jgi:hypothetical protein
MSSTGTFSPLASGHWKFERMILNILHHEQSCFNVQQATIGQFLVLSENIFLLGKLAAMKKNDEEGKSA